MAGGYIGKISAVVTANTSDLSRKLNGAKGDVDTFAQRLVRSFNSASQAAGKSFDSIFTPLQRLQRQFTGRELFNLGKDSAKIQRLNKEVEQLTLAARQLAAPLADAAKKFDALSFGAQRGFSDSLSKAQAELLKVRDSVKLVGDAGQSGFASISSQVQKTIISINQLADATQRLRALPTGNELEFSDPLLAGRLASARRVTQQAMSLAPQQIAGDPQIGGLVQQINRVAELSIDATARLKNALATGADTQQPQRDISRLGVVFDGLIAKLDRKYQVLIDTKDAIAKTDALKSAVNFTLSGVSQSPRGLGLFGSLVGTQAEQALKRAKELDIQFRSLPDAAKAGIAGLAGIAARVADEVDRTGAGAENLTAILDRLAPKIAAARPPGQAPASAGLIVRPPDSPDIVATRGSLIDDFAARQTDREIALRRGLGRQVDDPVRQLSGLESRIVSVKSSLDSLPASVSSRFVPAIQAAEAELVRMSLSPGRTAEEIERLASNVRRLEADSRRAGAAMNFRSQFGSAEAIGVGIDASALRGYQAQLELLQSTLGRVAREARGPAAEAIARLGQFISTAMENGATDTAGFTNEVRRLTAEAVRETAQLAGVTERGLARRLRRAGDIGRGFSGNIGLAVQQAAFAFEDFFSVVGGIDQRIRAAGNNISQLGFILGGAWGLGVGIAVGVGAQFVAMLLKWSDAGKTAEDRTKTFTKAIEKQAQLASRLAQSLDSVASSLSGLNDFGPLREFDAASRDARVERLASSDPGVRRQRDRLSGLERRRQEASRIGDVVSIQFQEQDARRRERSRTQRIRGERLLTADEVSRMLGDPLDGINAAQLRQSEKTGRPDFLRQAEVSLESQLRSKTQERDRLSFLEDPFGSRRGALNAEINRINRELEKFRFALSEAGSAVAREALGASLLAQSSIESAQQSLSNAVGEQATEVGVRLAELSQRFADAQLRLKAIAEDKDLSEGERLTAQQRVRDDVSAIDEQRAAIVSATKSVVAFQEALDRAAGSLAAAVAQEAATAAEQARRDANLAAGRSAAGVSNSRDINFSQRQRERAQKEADRAAARQREIAEDGIRLRNRFESDVPPELREAVRRRDEAQQRIDQARRTESDPASTPAQRSAAVSQRQAAEEQLRAAQAQVDAAFDQSAAAKQQREAADENDRVSQRNREVREQLQRGRDLIELPGQRAGREAAQRIADLNAARQEAIRNNEQDVARAASQSIQRQFTDIAGTEAQRAGAELRDRLDAIEAATAAAVQAGVPNARAQGDAAKEEAIRDSLRASAPTIVGLSEAVANAVLQGPSRAALNVTDVTTSEGARELSRLLRGDDSARNQADLVALQRESRDLLQRIADLQQPAAVAP